jgi:hypothetical protein
LYHVGEQSLPDAFARIARRLKVGDAKKMLAKSNTVFMLEVLLQRHVYAKPLELKSGSARQSVKVFVLRGFLETHILVLCSRERQHSHQNGQNSEFTVEMTLEGTYSGILAEDCCPSHRAWKPAPNAGSHISTATTTAGC